MHDTQFKEIEDAINVIEDTLKENLDLDEISKSVGISKYHLHRLFKSITGKSLMTYVRGRRLSKSLTDLLETKMSILEIAKEYRFDYEQSYIRSFRQMFQITPGQFRKNKCELEIEQKIDSNSLHSMEQGIVIEPKMCMKPQFYIQGILKEEINHDENIMNSVTNKQVKLFEKIFLPKIENVVDCKKYIGRAMYEPGSEFCTEYAAAIEVSKMNEVKLPFVCYEIPAQEYAVFRYIGLHSPYDITCATLDGLYDYIRKWKKRTAYEPKSYNLEFVDLRVCSNSYCEMDIYLPVIAK